VKGMDRKNENHDGEIKDRKKVEDDGSPEKSLNSKV